MRYPADIADPQRSKGVRPRFSILRGLKETLYAAHGRQQLGAPGRAHRLDHCRYLLPRRPIERIEGRTPFLGQQQPALTRIEGGANAPDEAAAFEFLDDAAHVAKINRQFARDLRRRRLIPIRQLIQDSSFGEGEFAAEQPLIKKPQLTRVEAVECPNDIDGRAAGAADLRANRLLS